ncbi:MAG: hypothetical protein ISS36_04585 [Candidatus Aenigmarchaeota archaeon]|nr:hypothetical protein [Candidatus Aenigmarchaeota archaeon]
MSSELAEFLGILVGDGHIREFNDYKTKRTNRRVEIVGHSKHDMEYLNNHIKRLFMKLFNLNVKVMKRSKQNTIRMTIGSTGLFNFLKFLGMNIGPKNNITIPKILLNTQYIIPFIRGLFDTDGAVALKKRHKKFFFYPTITIRQKSEKIIRQLEFLLKCLGFSVYVYYNEIRDDGTGNLHSGHKLDINGKRNLDKWMNIIGFNNPKHLVKVKKCMNIYSTCKVRTYNLKS